MATQRAQTLTGVLTLVPNPCTTRPCLPGMALAIVVGPTPYFLTRNGTLCRDVHAWGRHAPTPGTEVTVSGEVETRTDVNDCVFRTIELVSLSATSHGPAETE
jgi:hypothetical protein